MVLDEGLCNRLVEFGRACKPESFLESQFTAATRNLEPRSM